MEHREPKGQDPRDVDDLIFESAEPVPSER